MKISGIVILASILAIGFVVYYTFYSQLKISSEEAKSRIAQNKIDTVLDVRTPLEYNLGHYPEAIHIPTAKLRKEYEQKLPNKDATILVYCNTGQRSRWAADFLHAKGYKNVRYITGPYWSLMR
jgi:rhodanese-related sulfurtransferase